MFLKQHICDNLIHKCDTLIDKPSSPLVKSKSKCQPCTISPQEEEYSNKIIDKFRKNNKKTYKYPVIRSIALGSDVLMFTKEEYYQLKIIDHGYCYTMGMKVNHTQYYLKGQLTLTPIYRLKKLAKMYDVTNEIKKNIEWGNPIEPSLHLSNNFHTGFFKRKHRSMISLLAAFPYSQSKYLLTSQPPQQRKYTNVLNNRQYFLNTNIIPTTTLPKIYTLHDKIQHIKDKTNATIQQATLDNIYMTKKRQQALYECQLLRNIKKTFGTQFYDNLQMTFDKDRPTETQHAEEDDPNDKENIVTNNEYEIEEILQKNRNRLKLARKRIIEKLQF